LGGLTHRMLLVITYHKAVGFAKAANEVPQYAVAAFTHEGLRLLDHVTEQTARYFVPRSFKRFQCRR
jgi:hypothetical protein